jgi:hypothetical protein
MHKDGTIKIQREYYSSGLSSVEALADARATVRQQLMDAGYPRMIAWLLVRSGKMSLKMHCDGCQTTVATNGQRHGEQWLGTGGWIHRADLDFCLECQHNGQVEVAIVSGQQPVGRLTLRAQKK